MVPAPEAGYVVAIPLIVTADFQQNVEDVGKALDWAGVGAIVVGIAIATLFFTLNLQRNWPLREGAYRTYRQGIGRAILLGLEVLVAADIIRTVAVSPTFSSVGVLAVIVVVRTFLSMTLQVELEGRFPWQQAPASTSSDAR
jgi:uncharacterized membrane protein